MLKSTTTKARQNIRTYIIRNYDPSSYDLPIKTDFPEIAKQILSCYWHEVGQYDIKRRISFFDSFANWAAGLPSILDTCYYYNRSAVDDLGEILEETEEEKAKFDERKAEYWLTHLIYRELTKIVNPFDFCKLEEV